MESLEALLELLTPLARLGRPALAAIDGRCGSGKSTLAGLAAERIQAVLDYISGMTDVFALDLYRKINGNSLPAV